MNFNKKFFKVKGNYTFLKDLDQGGCGTTHLFVDNDDNMVVVFKRIKLFGKNSIEQKELIKEAQIMKLFDHPNIIKMKDYYIDQIKQELIIIMEYAEGGDLYKKIIDSNLYFNESQILDWFIQICLALKHMHDRKILHRDIKTQNIFLNSFKQIKLGDFGISSQLLATNNFRKTFCGTYLYISPEIIKRKPYQYETDIWSLGVVLYEICCLKIPFSVKWRNIRELEDKIKRGIYEPIPNRYSKDLKNLISLLLQVNPSKRPTINQILNLDFIRSKIKNFLNESKLRKEFPEKKINNFFEKQQNNSKNYNVLNYLNNKNENGNQNLKRKFTLDLLKINENNYNIKKNNNEEKKLDWNNFIFEKKNPKKKNYIKLSNLKLETNKLKSDISNDEIKKSIYKKNEDDYKNMVINYKKVDDSVESSINSIFPLANTKFFESFEKKTENPALNNFSFKNYLNDLVKDTVNNNEIFKLQTNIINKRIQNYDNLNKGQNLLDINLYRIENDEYKEILFLNTLLNN